ncbi:MAG: PPC domain-containing protein [Robiginitomaculum sp.]|nr:PPC domain-containing protein [Robiginitomaculum sp.]
MTTIPGNSSTTVSIEIGTSVLGAVDFGNDHDWYRVDLIAGVQYEFRLHGVGVDFDELQDPYLRLYNPNGITINALNDDAGFATWDGANGADSRIVFTAGQTGTYFLDVASFSNTSTGDYLITAVEANPGGMVFTVDEIAWQLGNNYADSSSSTSAAFVVGVDGSLTVNISALTAQGQSLAWAALQAWTNVTGIDFVITTGSA